MIIYNNATGQIFTDVTFGQGVDGQPVYLHPLCLSLNMFEHTKINDGDTLTIVNNNGDMITICDTVSNVTSDSFAMNGYHITDFKNWKVDKSTTIKTVGLMSVEPSPSKFDQLQELWKSGKSQIDKHVKLINFIRLVDGDLSHIGEGLLNGEIVLLTGDYLNYLDYSVSDVESYTIKKKQVTLTLDADLVDDLLGHPYVMSDLLDKLQTQIKGQL